MIITKHKSYIPSNSDEAIWFTSKFCEVCRKDTGFRKENGKVFCSILGNALSGEKVKQWIYDEESKPVCTSFIDYRTYRPKIKREKKGQLNLFS